MATDSPDPEDLSRKNCRRGLRGTGTPVVSVRGENGQVAEEATARHNHCYAKLLGLSRRTEDRLLIAGIDGEWVEGGSGVWQLRCPDGANLNWSSTRGTIWCQGKQPAKSALEAKSPRPLKHRSRRQQRPHGLLRPPPARCLSSTDMTNRREPRSKRCYGDGIWSR